MNRRVRCPARPSKGGVILLRLLVALLVEGEEDEEGSRHANVVVVAARTRTRTSRRGRGRRAELLVTGTAVWCARRAAMLLLAVTLCGSIVCAATGGLSVILVRPGPTHLTPCKSDSASCEHLYHRVDRITHSLTLLY